MIYTIENDRVICAGTWPKTKAKALDESIKKWKAIVLYLGFSDGKELFGLGVNEDQCALCQIYCKHEDAHIDEDLGWNSPDDCKNCPVFKKTGKQYCEDTPYDKYMSSDYNKQALKQAILEVKFLESLK